ncbi:MAG TPA: SDR family oxidoreductase [Acidimicrobiales bacterium]|nr:SDR family oxidoreductase [Acidimicrobiales bacterium]
MNVPDMSGKTVVVTGGNSGIGLETALALSRAGAKVVITARDRDRGESAVKDIESRGGSDVGLSVFDLASLASVREGAADILDRCPRIDVLVNNAGVVLTDRQLTVDGYESTFAINHLGPFLLTKILTDRIRDSAPSRIVNVASSAHRSARTGLDFDDLQSSKGYSAMQVYGKTKLANILFTTELARRLDGSGVTSNAVHPGTVATGYGRDGDTSGWLALGIGVARPFMKSPEKGAKASIYVASSPDVANVTGGYFIGTKQRTPSSAARDEAGARRLWEVSEQLVEKAGTP